MLKSMGRKLRDAGREGPEFPALGPRRARLPLQLPRLGSSWVRPGQARTAGGAVAAGSTHRCKARVRSPTLHRPPAHSTQLAPPRDPRPPEARAARTSARIRPSGGPDAEGSISSDSGFGSPTSRTTGATRGISFRFAENAREKKRGGGGKERGKGQRCRVIFHNK